MASRTMFSALGGGQNIGASCYYLNISGNKILLDCGMGIHNRMAYAPEAQTLIESGELSSFSQLDGIFISHAHFDHIAYLPILLENNPDINIHATYITKEIGQYIMHNGKQMSMVENAGISNMFYYMNGHGYNEKIHLSNIDVTLYPAGHIPGAAMVYIESDEGNVLYTGDFSMNETFLTGKCILPDKIKADTVIMCGVHAKHPGYVLKNHIDRIIQRIAYCIKKGQSVYLNVKQLTKGIEFVNIVNKAIEWGEIKECPIFYDDKISKLGKYFNQINIQTFSGRCSKYENFASTTGVYIGSQKPWNISDCHCIEADFSLHSDYDDICNLLDRLTLKKLFVVHTVANNDPKKEHELERSFQDITVYYPENKEMYLI